MRWKVEEETSIHLPSWREQEAAEQGQGEERKREKKSHYHQVLNHKIIKNKPEQTLMVLDLNTVVFPQHLCSSKRT